MSEDSLTPQNKENTAFDAFEEPAILTNDENIIVSVNQSARDLFSFEDLSFMMGRDVGCLFSRDQAGWPLDLSETKTLKLNTQYQSKRDISLSLSVMQLEDKSFKVGLIKDISSVAVDSDEGIERAEIKVDSIMGNLPVALFQMALSEAGVLSFPFVSERADKIFGMSREKLMTDPAFFTDLIPQKDRIKFLRRIRKSALHARPFDEEVCLQLDNDRTVWLRLFANIRHTRNAVTTWDGAAIDITEEHLLDERLHFLAYHDEDTGLPNRLAAEEHIGELLKAETSSLAVMALTIDRLDLVNDTLGRETSVRLVRTVANHLRRAIGQHTYLAHPRSDTFYIVLSEFENEQAVGNLAERVLSELKIPFEIGSRSLDISASMGINIYQQEATNAETLMMNADTALRRAHVNSPGSYRFYTEEMNTRSLRVLAYENRLRKAIKDREFTTFYQPLVSFETGEIAGMEALVRWRHPRLGVISPGEFIPVAEEAGLIGDICQQVLYETCSTSRMWLDMGLPEIPLAVNISWRQFAHPDRLMDLMNSIINDTGVPAHLVELELTESSVMEEPDSAIRTLNNLREYGVTASIDDFGTGYSSLSYLKRLPISKLKIDRAFIIDVIDNKRDAAIVEAIISLAKALGLKTVAEGIETREQFEFLREKGCDIAQGFYFSRPVPAYEMEKLIRDGGFSI